MKVDIKRRPRITLHDFNNRVIFVSYPASQDVVDRLEQQAAETNSTITVKYTGGNHMPATDKQRKGNAGFFNRQSKGCSPAPGTPTNERVRILLPTRS